MGQCFVPDCRHTGQSHTCKFFRFPPAATDSVRRRKWIQLIRRDDRVPNQHSRVCSCHFRDGDKTNLPELFERNKGKLFPSMSDPSPKRKRMRTQADTSGSTQAPAPSTQAPAPSTQAPAPSTQPLAPSNQAPAPSNQAPAPSFLSSSIQAPDTDQVPPMSAPVSAASTQDQATSSQPSVISTHPSSSSNSHSLAKVENLIREHDLNEMSKEISDLKKKSVYKHKVYSVSNISDKVLSMETGLHSRNVFNIVVNYVFRFADDINYYSGWKVGFKTIKLEDQIFITLMKLRHNYTNLHLSQLFGCSDSTISNIVLTYVHVLHKLLFEDIMQGKCPSRHKNCINSPASFICYPNCKMVIDCTDFAISIPKDMDKQKVTYSSYRGMNSFKALVGVSPNGVINFVSKLYPGSTSDKSIVQNCGILDLFSPGDLILADKGFLIQDVVPTGVTVNIPPFLQHGQFTESEIMLTKQLASCRIHVERANARLKNFKILSFIPPMLKEKADIVFQLIAALVNLQFPLIKETAFT